MCFSHFFKQKKTEVEAIDAQSLTILGKIDTGGSSTVYKGKWNDKSVAVKKIQLSSNENRSIAENEMKQLSELTKLNAPYVVKFFSYHVDDSNYYIVMEPLPFSLDKFIDRKKNNPFDWSLRYKIIKQVAIGIQFLHDHFITHGDIKSNNILLDNEMNAKLCDFGLAKHFSVQKTNIGTLSWMSPEVMCGKPYTEKSEIFSFSMTMWEIAAWKIPYLFLNPIDTVIFVSNEKREAIPTDCPIKIAKLIQLGWHQNPKSRPTAKAIVAELSMGMEHPLPPKLK